MQNPVDHFSLTDLSETCIDAYCGDSKINKHKDLFARYHKQCSNHNMTSELQSTQNNTLLQLFLFDGFTN